MVRGHQPKARKTAPVLIVILVIAFCCMRPTAANANADDYLTYYAAGSPGEPPIALNEGIMPFADFIKRRNLNCFDSTTATTPTTGGSSTMSLYIVERSIWNQAQQQQHLTQGFGIKSATSKVFGGSVSYDSSVTSTVESVFSEDSVVVILEVDASTGTVQSEPTLNSLGQIQLAAGRLNFLQHCGILYATREDLGAHFYVVINIHTESAEAKSDILKSAGFDGSLTIYGVSPSAKITKSLDQKIDQKSGVTSFDIRVTARTSAALAGLGDLVTALQGVTQSPLQSAITAAGKFLSAHSADTGAVDTIYLSPIGDLVGPKTIQYSNFDARVAFAEKVLSARPALGAIVALAGPAKQVPNTQAKGDWASLYLLAGVHNLDCGVPRFGAWKFTDTIICQGATENGGVVGDVDKLLPTVNDIVADCMYASDDQVADLCDPDKAVDRLINHGALFPSSAGGIAKWLTPDQVKALKQQFSGVDVDGALSKPDQALNPSLLNVIDAGRAAVADSKFPELASIDTLGGIYARLSSDPDRSANDIISSRVPFADVVPKSTSKSSFSGSSCANTSGDLKLDGTLDVSNLKYDIELNFTGPLVLDQIIITSENFGHQTVLTVTQTQKGDPAQNNGVSSIVPWLFASCSIFRRSLDFDLRAKLLELGGSGRIVVSYWDLHGHHQSTVQTFRVANKQLFLTNVFDAP